jgi:hypothetical protein
MIRIFLSGCFLFGMLTLQTFAFEKVILWGHKLHSSTHSYIHNAFYRAFEHMGYPVYWFDDQDDVGHFDFSDSLFITEGNVDGRIPLRADCDYILHYCDTQKYRQLIETGHCIFLSVFTNERVEQAKKISDTVVYVDKGTYKDVKHKLLLMPWATDLLPHEIEKIKEETPRFFHHKDKKVYWVGTVWDGPYGNIEEINAFARACKKGQIDFVSLSFLADPKLKGISVDENIRLVQRSFMAPAIVGTWQKETGMIPCRIFKNISYGQMGITNSKTIYEFFDRKIVYNPDCYQLFFDAEKRLKKLKIEELYELMDVVKTKHTYLNRIQTLLSFFEEVKASI